MLRTQVDVVLDNGAAVLNAATPGGRPGPWLSRRRRGAVRAQDTLPAIVEHRATTTAAPCCVKKAAWCWPLAPQSMRWAALDELTFGRNAVVPDTDALLAAIGAAWAWPEHCPDLIGAGIRTSSLSWSPLASALRA